MSQIDTSTTGGKIAVMSAFERGEKIECAYRTTRAQPSWTPSDLAPGWNWQAYDYRIADPYTDLKAAHAAGKTIQCNAKANKGKDYEESGWVDADLPKDWSNPGLNFRIKPLEFPEPPVGEQWHNPAGVTAEQVEIDKGYRLLTKSENLSAREDRFQLRPEGDREAWIKGSGIWDGHKNCGDAGGITYRTRLPLPTPKKRVPLDRNEWINGAPWFVRLKPKQPEDDTRLSVCMVTMVNGNGIYSASGGGSDFWTFEGAASDLERTKDGVTFEPCDKEAE